MNGKPCGPMIHLARTETCSIPRQRRRALDGLDYFVYVPINTSLGASQYT